MGSGFIEKHKRKSLLAALLLFLRSRAKYIVILLLVLAVSVPFVVSSDTFGRMLKLPVVVSVFKAMGMDGIVSALNPAYSGELVKSLMDKAAADNGGSYWSRLMGTANPAPCGSGCASSLAMVKGGDLFYSEAVKGKRPAPDEVADVVSAGEKARGEGAEVVDLVGSVMGASLADRYSGSNGPGPYVNRSLISKPGGIGDRKAGMYAGAMNQAGGKIPVPGRAQKVSAKMTGRASGFSWRNVRYKTSSFIVGKNIGGKRSMFQLAETFSTGESVKSRDSAYEYQAAYTGATYDGNDINLDAIQTDASASLDGTGVPGGFTDILDNANSGQKLAEDCANSQGVEGKKISDDAAGIDNISKGMGSPPKCYDHGAVDAWNDQVVRMRSLCEDFNVSQTALSAKCQTSNEPMGCENYSKSTDSGGMLISKCSEPNKWIMWLIAILCVAILIAIAVLFGPLLAAMAALAMYIAYSMFGGSLGGAGGADSQYTSKAVSAQDSKQLENKSETKP